MSNRPKCKKRLSGGASFLAHETCHEYTPLPPTPFYLVSQECSDAFHPSGFLLANTQVSALHRAGWLNGPEPALLSSVPLLVSASLGDVWRRNTGPSRSAPGGRCHPDAAIPSGPGDTYAQLSRSLFRRQGSLTQSVVLQTRVSRATMASTEHRI